MKILPLHITRRQNGSKFFFSPSPSRELTCAPLICHNLRPQGDRQLVRTGTPATVATLGGEPFIADRRDSRIWFLRQEDDGSIIVDGYRDLEADEFIADGTNLGGPQKTIVSAHAVGRFVVLLFDDGTLGYIIYNHEEKSYLYLGEKPELPSPRAVVNTRHQLSETVGDVTFTTPVADPRSGIDATARADMAEQLAAAWQRLRSAALAAGLWLQPVELRLAYRMADGTLLHVSGPQRIAADWQCGGKATLTALFDSDGNAAGTTGGTLSATGYNLTLEPDTMDLGVWEEVIESVEVWVSEESDPVDYSSDPVVGFLSDAHPVAFTGQLVMRPEASLSYALSCAPCGVLLSLAGGEGAPALAPEADTIYNLDAEALSSEELPREGVRCIMGHDGFLHLATSDALITCARNNPLLKKSATPGDWSDTRLMVPQIWGGGAYTRQIVYIADAANVSALAHDSAGNHTNCRIVCHGSPPNANFVALADNAVHMLLEDGTLTRFKGTRAEPILTGIRGCAAIVRSRLFDELTLLPSLSDAHAVVLCGGDRREVFTHDLPEGATPVPGEPSLIMTKSSDGVVTVRTLDEEDTLSDTVASVWMSETEMPESDGMWRTLRCCASGTDVDYLLSFAQSDPSPDNGDDTRTLTRMHVRGTPKGVLDFRIRPGATQPGILRTRGHWHTRITGRFASLTEMTLTA